MTPPSPRVLVTGATGFLGRQILRALSQRPDLTAVAACRAPARLPTGFTGECRVGDLRDPSYRRNVVQGIDVVCHAGTWGAFWGHAEHERRDFLAPTLDLIACARAAGVARFIQNSTLVAAAPPRGRGPVDETGPGRPTGFWPHLDLLIEVENALRAQSGHGMQAIVLRLGHFVGAGNQLGLVPALLPRLRTHLVPWLAGGRARLPLVADSDLGEAFSLAALAPGLPSFSCFAITGAELPTAREVFTFLAEQTGAPLPHYSVPYAAGYAFGGLMEALFPLLPGKAPFLTRSLVHVAEDWPCTSARATTDLGYHPRKDWRTAIQESLIPLRASGFPWSALHQPIAPAP